MPTRMLERNLKVRLRDGGQGSEVDRSGEHHRALRRVAGLPDRAPEIARLLSAEDGRRQRVVDPERQARQIADVRTKLLSEHV
jgi:hypothetical protein